MRKSKEVIFYENVGENIRSYRTRNDLTQEQVAKKVGLSRASIVNIEKGRQRPTLRLMHTLSIIFDTSIYRLTIQPTNK